MANAENKQLYRCQRDSQDLLYEFVNLVNVNEATLSENFRILGVIRFFDQKKLKMFQLVNACSRSTLTHFFLTLPSEPPKHQN